MIPPAHTPLRTDAGPLDVDYGTILNCIHCGLCLPSCPTFQLTGAEKHSPRGRIQMMRAVADDRLPIEGDFTDSLDFCLGCYACETACPAGVDYSVLFEASREAIERDKNRRGVANRFANFVLRRVFTSNKRLKALARSLRLARRSGLQGLGVRSGLLKKLAPKLAALEPMAPAISRKFADQLIRPVERPKGAVKVRVGLLKGCVMNVAFADVQRQTADLLLACGAEVHFPDAPCCGALHGHQGDLDTARDLARRVLTAFEACGELDALVVNAAGCGAFLKEYGHLLSGDPDWAARAARFAAKVRDVSEFLLEVERPAPKYDVPVRATYHDACHLAHAQGVTAAPRALLAEVPGLDLVPLPDSTTCCGSAGLYNVLQPEAASALLARKMDAIRSTGATLVLTGNPGCALQIAAGARQFLTEPDGLGPPVEVAHPVTILHRAWLGPAA